MLALGILRGAARAIVPMSDGAADAQGLAPAILDALAIVLAWGLAGWAVAVACRLASATMLARAERSSRTRETFIARADRSVAAIERLAAALELRPIAQATAPPSPPDLERRGLLARIDQAGRSSDWDDAEVLLDDFAARFPDDPEIPAIRERLEAARREETEDHLARIHAAREVNDAERVLELYRAANSLLESERRLELERELAGWFLDAIHRRLRAGRIQLDVVHLAAQVADTFAATVAGASLRASLPTLRRSVGLCPRCAQPYTGTAAACPRCLAGPTAPPPPDREMPDDTPDSE